MTHRFLIPFLVILLAIPLQPAEPDYSAWTRILRTYYDPDRGMDYRGLVAKERPALDSLRSELSKVDPQALSPDERLAFWINLYNLTTVREIVDHYPVASIRDLSTDPILRLNVFKRTRARTRRGEVSLQDLEDKEIREAFRDPRIHFAINCAARSCPPLRTEAFTGGRLNDQLNDQAWRFLQLSTGLSFEEKPGTLVLHLSKIFDWFRKDFDGWARGTLRFLQAHLPTDQVQRIRQTGSRVEFRYETYDWSLNDWKR